METKQKRARFFGRAAMGVAVTLMLAGIATTTQGQIAPGVGSPYGGEGRKLLGFKGSVICAGCDLTEARKVRPDEHNLYQLIHRNGQVVMNVTWVESLQGKGPLTETRRIYVRAEDSVFEKLTVEENLFKEVEIVASLNGVRTLDIFQVIIPG